MQWSQKRCYELPCSYDLNGLHDELLFLVKHVAQCKKGAFHPYFLSTPRQRSRRLQSTIFEVLDNVPTYIIVEGFILFAEPAIVHQLDKLVWLQVPWHLSSERRCKREGRPRNDNTFHMVYRDHIHAAHLSVQGLLRRNVAHRHVHEVGASGDADDVFRKVFDSLSDA